MRGLLSGSLAVILSVIAPVAAKAQARVPDARSAALGVDIGVFVPTGNQIDQLDAAAVISGLFEYYVTPRVSLRGSGGWCAPSLKGSSIDKVREIPIELDVNYNWERGKWHPFLGAGFGAYFMDYRRRGESLGSETNLSVNAGGGIEYFFRPAVAFKGEGRYHTIGDIGRIDPSGVAFTAGLKTYF